MKREAKSAEDQFARALAASAKEGKGSAESMQRLQQASERLASAQKAVDEQSKKVSASLAAQGVSGKATQSAMQSIERGISDVAKSGGGLTSILGGMTVGVNGFLAAVGGSGALYTFQNLLQQTLDTGREYQLTIRQAQAVTGDFSSTLRDQSMLSKSGLLDTKSPTELAKTYRELGQAGATTNEIVASTPTILDFSTAAMLDMEDAATAVVSTAKAYNIALTDTGQITDAFTESMNRGALSGKDFVWIMSSVGSVGKLANQNFREILAAGSVLRDSGQQAQDAGTSIKSALLALINPSDEAKRAIESLGIQIYDQQNRMKQWSDIVAEFERTTAGMDEKSRQLALTTIFGSDGIRAMATSLNKGSAYLRDFTNDIGNADGATKKMATAMADTYDGAVKRFNASLERTKILLFEGFGGGAGQVLGVLGSILNGFNSLDDGSRKLVETLIGGAGLVAAVTILTATLRALGITMAGVSAFFSGPVGWITALTAVVGIGTTGFLAYKGAQEQSNQAAMETASASQNLRREYETLTQKIESGTLSTEENKQAKERLKSVIQQIAQQMPSAISQWDAHGNAISVDTARLNENTAAAIRNAQANQMAVVAAKRKAFEDYAQFVNKDMTKEAYLGRAEGVLNEEAMRNPDLLGGYQADQNMVSEGLHKVEGQWAQDFNAAKTKLATMYSDFANAQADLERLTNPDWNKSASTPSGGGAASGGGGRSWSVPDKAKSGGSAAKDAVQSITENLRPYEQATKQITDNLNILTAKEQFLQQLAQAGVATEQQKAQLVDVRRQKAEQLVLQQQAMSLQADAERKAILELRKAEASATDKDAAKQYRQEIDSLRASVASLGQQWWQVEAQKLAIDEADQRMNEDAYQRAKELAEHEIKMGRMSSEEQIRLLDEIVDAHQWSAEMIRRIEEDKLSMFKKLYSEQAEAVREALNQRKEADSKAIDAEEQANRKYLESLKQKTEAEKKASEDRIQALEDEKEAVNESVDAQIEAIQRLMDALDDEQTQDDREAFTKQHNDKLAELAEKLRQEQMRTGEEHRLAVIDLQKQMADEEYNWQQTQDKWRRDDQKDAYQQQVDSLKKSADARVKAIEDEIDDLKRSNDEKAQENDDFYRQEEERLRNNLEAKKQANQQYYQETEKLISDKNLTLLAQAATANEGWYQTGLAWMQALQAGINSGILELPSMPTMGGSSPSSSGGKSSSSNPLSSYRTAINEIVYLKGEWQKASQSGNSTGMASAASEAQKYYAKLPSDLASTISSMNYDQAYSWYKAQRWHIGGQFASGMAPGIRPDEMPMIAKLGEWLIPEQTMLQAKQSKDSDIAAAMGEATDRIVAAIERKMGISIGNLMNIENVDGGDMHMLNRQAVSLLQSVGG
ncbi:phage tail tape measure protein [Heliobacterium chlorum]|uniref:phage tail tape measure protein n=1 Tax=Heliobacterium chlorum TaxID=2698 RepID=UPI00311A977F